MYINIQLQSWPQMQNVRLFRIIWKLNYLLYMRVLGMWKGVQLAQHFFRRIVAVRLPP